MCDVWLVVRAMFTCGKIWQFIMCGFLFADGTSPLVPLCLISCVSQAYSAFTLRSIAFVQHILSSSQNMILGLKIMVACTVYTYMGQILQDGENGCFMSNFLLKVEG